MINKALDTLTIPVGPYRPAQDQPITLEPSTSPTAKPKKRTRGEQARINGAKSKGPTTAAGKNTCSRSALKHGLTALKHTVLDIEDDDEFLAYRRATVEHFRPSSAFTLALVESLASTTWRKDRLKMLETAYFNHQINEELENPIELAAEGHSELAALVRSWIKSAGTSGPIELLRRYIATLTHEFNTTLSNLLKLEKRDQQRRHDPKLETPYVEPALPPTKRSQEAPVTTPIDIAIKRKTPQENRP